MLASIFFAFLFAISHHKGNVKYSPSTLTAALTYFTDVIVIAAMKKIAPKRMIKWFCIVFVCACVCPMIRSSSCPGPARVVRFDRLSFFLFFLFYVFVYTEQKLVGLCALRNFENTIVREQWTRFQSTVRRLSNKITSQSIKNLNGFQQ